jgi:hypothetical protein
MIGDNVGLDGEDIYDCMFVCDVVSEDAALVSDKNCRGWTDWLTPFQMEMQADPSWWLRFGRDEDFEDVPF